MEEIQDIVLLLIGLSKIIKNQQEEIQDIIIIIINGLDQHEENHHVAPAKSPTSAWTLVPEKAKWLIESFGIYSSRCTKRWYSCSIPKLPFQKKTNGWSGALENEWLPNEFPSRAVFNFQMLFSRILFSFHLQSCGCLKQKTQQLVKYENPCKQHIHQSTKRKKNNAPKRGQNINVGSDTARWQSL